MKVGSISGLSTPCVLADLPVVQRNISAAAAIAREAGTAFRPHAKTHKCRRIASLQIEAGACGLTVATFEEARCFLAADCKSISWAFPAVQPKNPAEECHSPDQDGAGQGPLFTYSSSD